MMVIKYFVYIVRCADGTLYTGKTTDLERRVRQHNGKLVNGAKYTRGRRPVTLIFFEEYLNSAEAGKREAEIKMLTRPQKEQLINKTDAG